MFHLLLNLIKYGYYDDTTLLRTLIDPILDVLDGRNDVKFHMVPNKGLTILEREKFHEFRYQGRFEVSECNNFIAEAKNAGLDVLEILLMFQLNSRTQVRYCCVIVIS